MGGRRKLNKKRRGRKEGFRKRDKEKEKRK